MRTTIYLATSGGVAVISGANEHWRGAVRLQDKHIQCVAAASNRGQVYCGTFGDGVFRSDDGGESWKASSGLKKLKVTALATSPSGALYAGTELSAIYRSEDAGATWRELNTLLTLPSAKTWSFPPRPDTHHVQAILLSLARRDRLHVAIEAGALLRSNDGGETWQDRVRSSPRDTHSFAVHAQDPIRLHSAAGDGYFESIDDGESWQRIADGLEHEYCWSVAISSADPTTLLLSASKNAYAAHFEKFATSFVYRRTGNEPWQQVLHGLPKPQGLRIPVVAASVVEPGVFYLSAEGQVYRSADHGLEWQKLPIQWDGRPEAQHAAAMTIVDESS